MNRWPANERSVDLDRLRRRYCKHPVAACPDPLAIGWPRDARCLTCGADIADLTQYAADPGSACLRRLRAQVAS